jgi:hypothetical protein
MNCDEAFDRLTAFPEPEDALLAAHLAGCPRCRAMQETLSPAIDWLTAENQWANDWEQSAAAPAWHLTAEAVQIAERTCRRLQTESAATARPVGLTSRYEPWGMLAALSLLVFFAVWLPPERVTETAPSAENTPAVASCTWQLDFRRDRPAQASAQQVIASCAACHLATP